MRMLLILCALFMGAVLWAGCGTTGKVKARIQFPGVRVHIDAEKGTYSGESEWAGWCYEIEWFDKDFNSLGKAKGGVGKDGKFSGSLPQGATSYETTFYRCEDEGGGVPPMPGLASFQGRGMLVTGAPIVPSTTYVAYAFLVDAASLSEARAIVHAILAAGTSAPLPSNVRVLHWVEGRYMGGMVRAWSFLPVSPAGVLLCDFKIGDLKPAVLLTAEGSWTRASIGIPLRSLAPSTVVGQLTQQTVLDAVPLTADATYTFE